MEGRASLIESLLEKAQIYAKTNIEIFKLQAIDKLTDIVSTIVAKLAIIVVALLIIFLVNIALSLWIGEMVGKSYYGFLIVAGFYVLIIVIMIFNKSSILKRRVKHSVVSHLLNNNSNG